MNSQRRHFLKVGALSLASFTMLGTLSRWAVGAAKEAAKKVIPLPAGKTEVPAADPVAMAIGYKSNPAEVDKKKYPQFKPKEMRCGNCALYKEVVKDGWGECQMMAGKGLVNYGGWCGSWSKKA